MRDKNGMNKAMDMGSSNLDVGVQQTLEEVIINRCGLGANVSREYTDRFLSPPHKFSLPKTFGNL